MFYLINKANDILTDPEKMKNYLEYGNPDGQTETKMSIAMPSFLFDSKNQLVVLISFAIFLLIILPYIVLKWFKSNEIQSDESGLSLTNINFYGPYLNNSLRAKDVPAFMSRTQEFNSYNNAYGDE